MAVTITPNDVKLIYKSGYPDELIQLYIDVVEAKIGTCVDSAYGDAQGKLIKMNLAAYSLSVAEGKQEVSSKTAPNGASISYNSGISERGLLSNQYGKAAFDLDQNGCWRAMVQKTAFIGTIGRSARSLYPDA
tara:strand:- start:248 stop:646 length:399 start_codon:yes stop_codon:yes gene_type:complete